MTENRGGKRKGAGRKMLLDLAGESRAEIIRDFIAVAKEKGTSFGTELGKIAFSDSKDKRTIIQAMRLFVNDVLPKVSERETTESVVLQPQIYLPEEYPEDDAPDYKPH